jgi:tetratricopeptide (TPR) repeat protein
MALERKPDLEGVHLKIAKLLFDTRDFDKALVECQQELELDPDSPHANLLMARLLERLGRRPEMVPYLKKLSSLRSTDDPELRSLPAGAAQILSSPDQPEVVCSSLAQCAQVARTLEKDKRYEDCRNVWESARGFGPLRPSMLSSLARVLYLTGHFTEVVSTLTPLQHGNQFSDEDRMLLGKSLLRLGDAERASQVLTAIKSSSNSYYEALYLEADCFGSMARSAFEELAMVAPNSYWTHVVMAESLALQGQTKKAIGEYFEALKLRPDAPALHLKIGNLYWKVLDDDNAVSQFLAEVSTYPFSAVANYALGHAYLEIHQLEDAVAYLRKATELDGSLTDAHRDLGKLYLLKKEPEKAVLELETAVRQDANDKAAHYHLYRAYAMLGSPAKAQAELAVFKRLEAGGTQKTLDSVERNEDRSPSPDIQR